MGKNLATFIVWSLVLFYSGSLFAGEVDNYYAWGHDIKDSRAEFNNYLNNRISFGAQATAETPAQSKNFLGGGAYTSTGVVKALIFSPLSGVFKSKP